MTTAFLQRRITFLDLLTNWFVSYFGNLAGMLFFMAIITGCKLTERFIFGATDSETDGGVFEIYAYRQETINFATQKCVLPQWHQILLRAIGANWLVCFAGTPAG